MSSSVNKYKIVYDGNDGMTYEKVIYCKFENVWDGQLWRNEDGTPVDFRCVTDSEAYVTAMCIANIPTEDKYFYWVKVKEFVLPEAVRKEFYK
jgi:hypothetical protein